MWKAIYPKYSQLLTQQIRVCLIQKNDKTFMVLLINTKQSYFVMLSNLAFTFENIQYSMEKYLVQYLW